ncbi:hypothetical protein MTO96_034713 [Rhipicephalus appendiculatus]
MKTQRCTGLKYDRFNGGRESEEEGKTASSETDDDDAAITDEAHYQGGGNAPSGPGSGPTKPPGPKTSPKTKSTTTTTRPPSTGYGYMVCTIGRIGVEATMLPIKEELCDLIVFTHVYVDLNGSLSPVTANFSFINFVQWSHRTERAGHRALAWLECLQEWYPCRCCRPCDQRWNDCRCCSVIPPSQVLDGFLDARWTVPS